MAKKISITHIDEMERIIYRLDILQAKLPDDAEALVEFPSAKMHLVRALEILKAELNAQE